MRGLFCCVLFAAGCFDFDRIVAHDASVLDDLAGVDLAGADLAGADLAGNLDFSIPGNPGCSIPTGKTWGRLKALNLESTAIVTTMVARPIAQDVYAFSDTGHSIQVANYVATIKGSVTGGDATMESAAVTHEGSEILYAVGYTPGTPGLTLYNIVDGGFVANQPAITGTGYLPQAMAADGLSLYVGYEATSTSVAPPNGQVDVETFTPPDPNATNIGGAYTPNGAIRAIRSGANGSHTVVLCTANGLFQLTPTSAWMSIGGPMGYTDCRAFDIQAVGSVEQWAGIFGDPSGGTVPCTKLGSAQWSCASWPTASNPIAIAISPCNANELVAVGSGELIFRSVDGGASWVDQTLPPSVGFPTTDFLDTVTFTPDGSSILAGGSSGGIVVYPWL